MPRDGTGTFTRTDGERTGSTIAQDQLQAALDITAALYDTELQDIADAITASLALDGQSTMVGNLKMGGFKVTGAGAAIAAGEAVVYEQENLRLRSTSGSSGVGGTVDLYRDTPSPADADLLYQLLFSGELGASAGKATYAAIVGRSDTVTPVIHDGSLLFQAQAAGTLDTRFEVKGTSLEAFVGLNMNGETIDMQGGNIDITGGSLIGGSATPAPGALDLDGQGLTLDEDGDSTITTPSDDTVELTIGGVTPTLLATLTANKIDLPNAAELDMNGGRITLGASGNTYLEEDAADEIKLYNAGDLRMTFAQAKVTMNTDLDMNGKNLILDELGTSRIDMATPGRMDFRVEASDKMQISTTLIEMLQNVDMNGNSLNMATGRIDLDGDADTGIRSPFDDQINFEISGGDYIAFGPGYYQFRDFNNPTLMEHIREDTSPTADDLLGRMSFVGTNDALQYHTYSQIRGRSSGITDGSEFGTLEFLLAESGAAVEKVRFQADYALFGKSDPNTATDGVELSVDGGTSRFITNTTVAAIFYRRSSSNGYVLRTNVGGAAQGGAFWNGSNIVWDSFQGAHPGKWAGEPQDVPYGTLLSAAGGMIDHRHPTVRVSNSPMDPAVYGTYQLAEGDGEFYVTALGMGQVRVVGPVQVGDYLCSSDVPGCAMAQPGNVRCNYTVGKAMQAHDGDGEGLIAIELA